MIVSPNVNRRNLRLSLLVGAVPVCLTLLLGGFQRSLPMVFAGMGIGFAVFWMLRRRCRRRMRVMRQVFPSHWKAILIARVRFYGALDATSKQRFEQMVQIFLDEVRVTGVRTEIDDTVKLLVAASAVIPIFGFHDWEYRRLREVLVYPASFNDRYQTDVQSEEVLLGMAGISSLSGVMILSKAALLAGFSDRVSQENVGIHEFAHLLEEEELHRGLPAEVPVEVVRQWCAYVSHELARPGRSLAHINDYGYTNEHELFAVLTEYFFSAPETLQRRDPKLYELLQDLFHQDPASLLNQMPRRNAISSNAPCPCGSGQKFKECCLPKAPAGTPG